MKLRVGLIGLGDQWKTMHRPALRMLGERFDVRAIYASVAKLAESAVAEFQADPVDGYQSLVQRDDIDAVLILENSWLRFQPAAAACRAGKAVYWAADLDFDPHRDCDFKACVEESGVAFMAGLPRRFAPATLRLKELIATQLGQPRLIFCHTRLSLENKQTLGRGEPGQSGGVSSRTEQDESASALVDEAQRLAMRTELVQLIDWCGYIVGRSPQSVASANQSLADGLVASSDYRALSLLFESNGLDDPANRNGLNGNAGSSKWPAPASKGSHGAVTAQISCGSYIPACWREAIGFRPPAAMQVCCERGVAFIDLPGTLVWFDDAGRHQESLESESPVGEKMLSQFHRAVTSLVRNLSGLEDAYRAAAILKAAEQSNQEGKRILLS